MNFENKPTHVVTLRDVSSAFEVSKLKAENTMLTKINSSVNHELLTPLRCMISLTKTIKKCSYIRPSEG